MKLREYFIHQQTISLSEEKKLKLFKQIQQKRQEKTLTQKRYFFSYKRISYSFLAFVLVALTFGGIWIERGGYIDNFFFSSQPGNISSVFAGNIAEIIEFNGEYYIQKGEQTISSKYITNWDVIHLKEQTEILFTLDDGAKAKIVGPAIFSITKSEDNGYKIILLEGNFLKIYNEKPEINVEIITDDISLFQDKTQILDLQIAKEGKELIIKNNGGEVKVSTKKDNKVVETTIKKEVISIQDNDINILQDSTKFTEILTKNNVSETLSLRENKPKEQNLSSEGENKPIQEIIVDDLFPDISEIIAINNSGSNTWKIDYENISSELGIKDSIKIPSKEQNEALKQNLNSFFLMSSIEKLTKASLENNEAKINESLSNLSNKLNTISNSFSLEISSPKTLSGIKDTALQLKKELKENFYIVPSQLEQLQIIANRCEYISQNIEKLWISNEESKQKWEEIKINLPPQLKFN